MKEIINEIGHRYGKLTVIDYAGQNKRNQALWLCGCDCGNTKVVLGSNLRLGITKSCGCLKKFPYGEGMFRYLVEVYKRNAKRRNIEWYLTDEEVRDLISSPCYYCGKLPHKHRLRKSEYNGDFPSNGIDRLDPKKGYFSDNVVSCCPQCNFAKNKLSASEFKNQVSKIYNHFINRE